MPRPRTGAALYESRCARHGGRCWRGVYYDADGRRRETQLHSMAKPDARRVVERLAAEAALDQAGVTCRAERMTLADYVRDVYLPDIERSDLASSTVTKKAEQLRDHILPALGRLRLVELTTEAVHGALRRRRVLRGPRQGEALSAQTLHSLDRVLSAVVHHAAARGYFGPAAERDEARGAWRKPWKSVRKPRPQVRAMLDRAELARVVDAAREVGGLRLASAVLLALAAGARRGELAEIKRGHVRPVSTGAAPAVDIIIPEPKKGGVRPAYLEGAPARLLMAYLASTAGAPDEPLFPATVTSRIKRKVGRRWEVVTRSRAGDPMRSYVVSDLQWERIRERAELPPGFRFHDLRGAFAKLLSTELAEADVQRALGHERAETTRIYTRTTRDAALKRAGAVLAQLPLAFDGASFDEEAP